MVSLRRRQVIEEGTPLSKNLPVPDGLASQPTLSRMVDMLSSCFPIPVFLFAP
jgi:hypothetical protein